MKLRQTVTPVLVLLGIVIVNGCALVTVETPVPTPDIPATVKAAVATEVAATQTAQAEPVATPTRTGTPTPSPTLPPSVATLVVESETVALVTHHGKYVTAMGEDDDWLLRQEPELRDCGQFTLQHLDGGEVALVTCHNRYVTASREGNTDLDWALGQETDLSPCGQFTLHDLGDGEFAFETCVHRYFTALDDKRSPELQWMIIAEADEIWDWERFTLQYQ